jgi:RHS repeat-associated protein
MNFSIFNGHAWFDRAGKSPSQTAMLVTDEAPARMLSSSTIDEPSKPKPSVWARLRNWLRAKRKQPPVSLTITMEAAQLPQATNTAGLLQRYSFYTPELNLMAETELTEAATPATEYEYVWFNGEPLAQIETATGAIHHYFNDHLGAPLLTTNTAGAVDWRVEREPYGSIFTTRAGAERHQPLGLPGQEYDANQPERAYNIFRWYRAGWGRYTQPDPIWRELVFREFGSTYGYARTNPVRYVDPDGLDVRVCCRRLQGLIVGRILGREHCYVESNTGGRRTWGLQYFPFTDGRGIPTINYPDDKGGACGPWKPDPCPANKCFDKETLQYPREEYSQVSANFDAGFAGRNSNTFAKCLLRKCGVPYVDPGLIDRAPGWWQPCPP